MRKVHEFPGQITIIAAGPLTNIAMASRLDPQFASLWRREFVFMGGSYNPTGADNEFAAEYANAPRLRIQHALGIRRPPRWCCTRAWKKITQVPIDPTTRTFFKPEFFQQLSTAGRRSTLTWPGSVSPIRCGTNWRWRYGWIPSIVTHSTTRLVDVDTSFTAGYGNT